jgi:hypothetical protein
MDILAQFCLVLNSKWQPIDEITVEAALSNLCKGALRGIDTSNMLLVPWSEWIELPIRSNDLSIGSVRGPVRVPRVAVAYFEGMPERMPRTVGERDNYRCAYSGDYCPDGTKDHVTAKSRGGTSDWENLVWSRRDINQKKGNKTVEEAGLRLRIKPCRPRPIKACMKIRARHPEWEPFVYVKK